ncbi:TPA: hypothetical protein EYP83_02815 [Candidatus Geothermarchaeota archaeon]|nr:hypothetical protein [Candidatus Geothermarchaeota archaeon]
MSIIPIFHSLPIITSLSEYVRYRARRNDASTIIIASEEILPYSIICSNNPISFDICRYIDSRIRGVEEYRRASVTDFVEDIRRKNSPRANKILYTVVDNSLYRSRASILNWDANIDIYTFMAIIDRVESMKKINAYVMFLSC